ncbi:MAG TPA: mannose-1-phosphate guanylyltransferase/mannose-6-phosphate isomerase [Sulfuricurvum sp.]|nr:mannose-1-phosphate guanylyltransferase/mannose-6-phosphate isomerase [Sulfuricurvum sp.]
MTNIILCGGSGTRLWPISRTLMPKQFVKLFENKSLFQLTVERNSAVCDQQLIVSNSEQYFLAFNQLEEINQANNRYILEPVGRNTAPAIALACMSLDPDEIVLVTPSDHLIKDQHAYVHVITQAAKLASDDYLVTFGITPTFPETGFGYIEASGEDVKAFHEKPTLDIARNYVEAGNYYWNSGMFCFKAGLFLNELEKFSPEIFSASMLAYNNTVKSNITRIKYEDMEAIPDNSIDYAVMEQSNRVKVIPSSIGWSDVGSFDALSEVMSNDENNNFILSDKPVNLIDVKDLIIIDTEDALLISHKGSSQKVKEIVQHYKQSNPELTHIHRTAHRPWGTYTVLEDTAGYKIKRIMVKPGKRLSLQKHFHRNEHWIVLSGTATVTVGDKTFSVHPNESTYIKAGEIHRLANLGKIPLTIIETQVGEYTGEDDIVRIEDDFDREGNE